MDEENRESGIPLTEANDEEQIGGLAMLVPFHLAHQDREQLPAGGEGPLQQGKLHLDAVFAPVGVRVRRDQGAGSQLGGSFQVTLTLVTLATTRMSPRLGPRRAPSSRCHTR